MTRLLVSVRDATEALAALEGGADLIDIKEPQAGSLGPADVDTWHRIMGVVGTAKPLSVALGELCDDGTAGRASSGTHKPLSVALGELCDDGTAGRASSGTHKPLSVALGELCDGSVADLARQTQGMRFAKIGLAGCNGEPDWSHRWHEALSCLPEDVAGVAVVYADHRVAGSPNPAVILQHAIRFGCQAILFDTFSKAHGHLFDHLGEQDLLPLLRDARAGGLQVVLGGSLRGDLVHRAVELEPDYIAVRGAVCRGDRRGTVEKGLIESLAEIVRAASVRIVR